LQNGKDCCHMGKRGQIIPTTSQNSHGKYRGSSTMLFDFRDLKTLLHTKWHRVCREHFRQDGILLPFQYSRNNYVVPNPILFRPDGKWMLQRQEDPFDGWDFAEVLSVQTGPAVRCDYGKLYCYVQDHLRRFHQRLWQHKIDIRMINFDTYGIRQLERNRKFDRIEVSSNSSKQALL
jgi:hypothetical protein